MFGCTHNLSMLTAIATKLTPVSVPALCCRVGPAVQQQRELMELSVDSVKVGGVVHQARQSCTSRWCCAQSSRAHMGAFVVLLCWLSAIIWTALAACKATFCTLCVSDPSRHPQLHQPADPAWIWMHYNRPQCACGFLCSSLLCLLTAVLFSSTLHPTPQALGFQLGVFHVECKYTSRGPRLIEVNARMGGGPVR